MADLEPRPVSRSEVTFARMMTQLDANMLGNVHGGVIMREVDVAAGHAAARHAGQVCVTAAIDELSFLQPVKVGEILVVHARVNGVGRSSLEVGVRVEAETWDGGEERRHTTSAYLVMVALDSDGKPTEVPPLLVESEDERRRQAQAEIRREMRRERIERLGTYRPEAGAQT